MQDAGQDLGEGPGVTGRFEINISPIPFGSRFIGPGFPVLVIAEIGINHEGSTDKCLRMVDAAAEAGADSVKLQIVKAEESYVPGTESHDLFKRAELPHHHIERIFKHAGDLGLEMFATCGDLFSFRLVERLNPAAYKISSGLLTHIPLIESISKTGKTVLMSTGRAAETHIDEAVEAVRHAGGRHVGLFQCTSLYPAPSDSLNLSAIRYFEKKYGVPVGFSDHSLGTLAAMLSVAAGACMIEKHFSLDPGAPGFDHPISLGPAEFREMVEQVRRAQEIMGSAEKRIAPVSLQDSVQLHRFLVAACSLKRGAVLEAEHVAIMRTMTGDRGLPPSALRSVCGRRIRRDIKQYSPITKEDIL